MVKDILVGGMRKIKGILFIIMVTLLLYGCGSSFDKYADIIKGTYVD